tara:strand:- start:3823 stop:5592 length:1770 start_codon:yes stop_codon:yes gene_type:complete
LRHFKEQQLKRKKSRNEYKDHIKAVEGGDLKWIYDPAIAYMGGFRDLYEDLPADRVQEWLGEEICESALKGFEACLRRADLPTAQDIAENYAQNTMLYYVVPMLAAAHERYNHKGFDDLSHDVIAALAMAAGLYDGWGELPVQEIGNELETFLRQDLHVYEAYIRQKIEPQLRQGKEHLTGVYRFLREDREYPLSTRLSLEWLDQYADLVVNVEREFVRCLIHMPNADREPAWQALAGIAADRLTSLALDDERKMFWRSVQFLVAFEAARDDFNILSVQDRNGLWAIAAILESPNSHYHHEAVVSIPQLQWIIATYRELWPYSEHPNGCSTGRHNAWDATRFIEWAIGSIAQNKSSEAREALVQLRDMEQDGYTIALKDAIAAYDRVKVEAQFNSPSLKQFKAVILDAPPQSAADVQAVVLDKLHDLNLRLRGHPLNLVNNFYDDNGAPRSETECRDQMLIALGDLPYKIQCPPEFPMPQGRRSDSAFTYGEYAVPLEAKGQWHREVWDAASAQLDRYYSPNYSADSIGIYVVFWFGDDVCMNKKLKSPGKNVAKPNSAEEMCVMLESSLHADRRGDIAIVVLDLTRSQ